MPSNLALESRATNAPGNIPIGSVLRGDETAVFEGSGQGAGDFGFGKDEVGAVSATFAFITCSVAMASARRRSA